MCDKFSDFCSSYSLRRGVAAGPSAATGSQFVARRRLAVEIAPRMYCRRARVYIGTVDARFIIVQLYCVSPCFNFFYRI
jgi:hypothetical protein